MGTQSMEIILIGARGLNNTSWLPRMAHAAAWISNDPSNKQLTPVDTENGATDPTWNHAMKFTLHGADLQQRCPLLEIAIYRNATFGDKEIGRVSIALDEIFKPTIGTVAVKPQGVLTLSVKLPQAVAGSYVTGCRPASSSSFQPSYPPANQRSPRPTIPRQACHPKLQMDISEAASSDAGVDDGDFGDSGYDYGCDFGDDF